MSLLTSFVRESQSSVSDPAGWDVGRYYDVAQVFPSSTAAGVAIAADIIYTSYLLVPKGADIDRIGIVVTATGTATLARLGLFRYGSDRIPSDLIEDFGTVDVSGTGNKEITIARSLPSGLLATALIADGSVTIHSYNTFTMNIQGHSTIDDVTRRSARTKSQAFGALPAAFGTPSGFTSTTVRIAVRAA